MGRRGFSRATAELFSAFKPEFELGAYKPSCISNGKSVDLPRGNSLQVNSSHRPLQISLLEQQAEAAVESATPTSPKRVQRTVENNPPAQDSGRNSEDQGESAGTTGSPSKNDSRKGPSQVVTRSRNKSGQSDADVSEAESNTSTCSTRVTRSRQSLGSITDSARKLRNHRSAVITEPILESKDEELSEAESDCSSVSTRARRIRACASQSTTARSKRSLLAEPVSDHSEAESNCSSVSGLQIIAIRSTRAARSFSMRNESQKEDFSEAESCNSDFVPQTQVRRSSRRVQSKPKAGEAKSVSETSSQEQESPKKQRYNLRGVKGVEPLSSAQEEEILSTPCRNLRNRIVSECSDITVLSDRESQSKEFSNKDSHIDESKESLKEPQPHFSVKHSSVLEQKLPETSQSANDASNEIIDLTEEMDEPQLVDQDQGRPADNNEEEDDDDDSNDIETADITKKGSPNLNTKTPSGCGYAPSTTEKIEISLLLDSDESEKSEDSEEEADIEMEKEENHQDLVEKEKLKQTSIEQSQDAVDNGLFVIDTAPGLDSSKKYYVDHHEDDKDSAKERNEEEEMSEPDDEEEDFIDEDVDDGDEEELLLTRPKSGM